MPNVSSLPFVKPHFHSNGATAATGYKIYSYDASTQLPIPLYKSLSGDVAYPNPLTLNERGEPDGEGIFLDNGYTYKIVLTTESNVPVWTMSAVNGVGTGSSTAVTSMDNIAQGVDYRKMTASQVLGLTEGDATELHTHEHDFLDNIEQADSGVLNGHISDQAQTIYGVKTFIDNVNLPSLNSDFTFPIVGGVIATREWVTDAITNEFVTIDGAQTIIGEKTFHAPVIFADDVETGYVKTKVIDTEVELLVESDPTSTGSRVYIKAQKGWVPGDATTARIDMGSSDRYIVANVINTAGSLPYIYMRTETANKTDIIAGTLNLESTSGSGNWMINGYHQTGNPATAGEFHISGNGIAGKHNGDDWGYWPEQLTMRQSSTNTAGFLKTDYLSFGRQDYSKIITASAGNSGSSGSTYLYMADNEYGGGTIISLNCGNVNDPVPWINIGQPNHAMVITPQDIKYNGVTVLNKPHVHAQGSAATVWTITHNKGAKPIVQAWNSTGLVINGTIQHVSDNQLTITFATAQSGGARCV